MAGVISALQSVIILMVITRVCNVVAAGVFTLAYANGNLFLNVGKFGMRTFQSSDRDGQFGFMVYRLSRVITTVGMVVSGCAYVAFLAVLNGYSSEKVGILVAVCLYLAVTSFEDVFHGNYQQHGRLDVASKLFSARVGSSIAVICVAIALSRSLLVGCITGTVYTAAFLVGEIAFARCRYSLPVVEGACVRGDISRLLLTCLPLFAAAFLIFYIGNAPRYAIDALMNDTAQAYYGYIAMPVFVVSLLAGFVYNPMITSLTDQWNAGQVRVFMMRFGKVALAIVGLTAVCDFAAFAVGVPLLDLLYNADTAPYLGDLLVLVTGGGFLALASLAVVGITIIRFQRVLVPAYVVVAVVAWVLSRYAVAGWGISGAAWSYLICMAVLATILVVLFVMGVRRYSRSCRCRES